ncbi:MAG: HDOD domain-containing protein, partial [Desulfobacterales bacterium]|nr:HDOD domain-containing protein [Desulfobacterales bacterium]
MREQIIKLLHQRGDLPPFPDLLIQLKKLLDKPDVSIPELIKIIELDAALVGKILKLANSAFYSSSVSAISSISLAVMKLGLIKIKHLIYSLELSELFTDNRILDYKQFWEHSIAVANFTEQVATYIHASREVQDKAYMAGLMHDVGIMVFAYLIPKQYSEFLKHVEDTEETLEKQELAYF